MLVEVLNTKKVLDDSRVRSRVRSDESCLADSEVGENERSVRGFKVGSYK